MLKSKKAVAGSNDAKAKTSRAYPASFLTLHIVS
jgi:hypothetical protein